jgi:hypothetical protein
MQSMRRGAWPALGLALVAGPALVLAQAPPPVPEVLRQAGTYLVEYAPRVSGAEAEEQYTQRDRTGGREVATIQLKSDFALLGSGDGSILSFRDVFDATGTAIRPHEDRLLKLFTSPPPDALQQARQLNEDGTAYFMPVLRQALGAPFMALEFLRTENQSRSSFKIESVKNANDRRLAVLRFAEQAKPRLVTTPDQAAAGGRFWVDLASGAVTQSELFFDSANTSVRVVVNYALDPKLGLWLPVSMDEHYEISGAVAETGSATVMGTGGYRERMTLDCHAAYGKYRQTPVDASKIIKVSSSTGRAPGR